MSVRSAKHPVMPAGFVVIAVQRLPMKTIVMKCLTMLAKATLLGLTVVGITHTNS